MPSPTKHLLFRLFAALFLLVIAEGLLHLLALSFRPVDALLSVEPIPAAVADRRLVWRGNPRFPEHDRAGFRNPTVPGRAEIVALGDSQTYGSQVARDQAWPRQLETSRAGRAYNMAFPGWGPLQGLLVIDEALELRPRFVVAAFYAGNDLVDTFTFVYERNKLDRFRTPDRDARRIIADAEVVESWEDSELADQNPLDVRKEREPDTLPEHLGELLEDHSRLYGLASGLRRAYDAFAERQANGNQDDLDDDVDHLALQTPALRTVLSPAYRLTAVDLDDPRVREGLRIAFEALVELHDRSAATDARLVVLFIPTKERAVADAAAAELGELPAEYRRLVQQEDRLRQALSEQLAARQIAFIDGLPPLRQLVASGQLPYSETDDGHLNPLGHHAVAEAVRGALE